MTLPSEPAEIAFSAYGSLKLHEWAESAYSAGSDADLYSLVMRQGAALEFANFGGARSPCAQWNLAEAGDCWLGSTVSPELFWIRFPIQQGRHALPLQSAGLVLERAIRKVGVISLDRLDVLMPLKHSRQDPMALAYGRDWFEFSDPASRRHAAIDLTTTGGLSSQEELVAKVAPWLGECLSFGAPTASAGLLTASRLIGDTAPNCHFEVILASDTLDFLAWVAEVFGWAVANESGGPLHLRFTLFGEL